MNNEDFFEDLGGNTVGGVVEKSMKPNAKVIDGKIAFEPLYGGIRVTARDASNKTLWGFVASSRMIQQYHCPVGIHTTLKELVGAELKAQDLSFNDDTKQVELAKKAIQEMQKKLDDCMKTITPENISKATIKNAQVIYKAIHDANVLIEEDLQQTKIGLPKEQNDESSE